MRKIKEVLRLHYQNNRSQRNIAGACNISTTTVIEYLKRAKKHDLSWPLPDDLSDKQLEEILYPAAPAKSEEPRIYPDFEQIHKELKRKGVTLQLLWQEYNDGNTNGIKYSRFCDLYRKWARKKDVWMPQIHKAGEKLFVDYAGMTIGITNPKTGAVRQAQIFIGTLGASSYSYAEATESQKLKDWIGSHVRAFTFFGGVTEVVVPDNLRSGVSRSHRYEPDLNPTYQELAMYYQVAVDPARVRAPKDKSKVEKAVLDIERQILAALRNRVFFSIDELNEAIWERLEKFNAKPFQKIPGSRKSMFEELEKPALNPLPKTPYTYAEWRRCRVGSNYHIEVAHHKYSVPYKFSKEKVDVRITENTVEIFYKGKLIGSHIRKTEVGGYSTAHEHRPASHRHHADQTPEKLLKKAKKTGPSTANWIGKILEDEKRHLVQREKICLGVLRLSKEYGDVRLEQACKRALSIGANTYKSIQSILKKRLDCQPIEKENSNTYTTPQDHKHIRGTTYFSY